MGQRRPLSSGLSSPSKRRANESDKFVKIESRHLLKHAASDWQSQARQNTSLPIVDKTGKIQERIVSGDDVEPEVTEARFKPLPKPKKDAAHEPVANYSACEKYLSSVQRQALYKADSELNSMNLLEFLNHYENLALKIIEDPTAELFKLESVYTRMNKYRKLFEACSDLGDLEDVTKSYLVIFVAIGKLLKHVLPGYVVVEQESKGEPQRSESRKAGRQYELLCLHLYQKWLLDNLAECIMKSDFIMSSPSLIEPICEVMAESLHSLKAFNLRDEYLSIYINLLARTSSSALFDNLALALQQDTQLVLATIVVPKILGTTLSRGKKRLKNQQNSSSARYQVSRDIIGRTMRLCDYLGIEKKENYAIAELSRKGLSVKEALKKSTTEVQSKIEKERALGMVSGDFKKFQENKKIILETMLQLFINVIRNPTNYSLETLYETLRALSKHANLINIEMVQELSSELKNLATVVVHSKKYSDSSASIILAAVLASIELSKLSSKNSDIYIETDTLWIVPAVIEATSSIAFTLSQSRGENVEILDNVLCNTKAHLTLEDLVEVLQEVIDSRKSLGSLGESFSHLAKCAGATKLYGALSAITVLTSNQTTVKALNSIRQKLLKRYPTIQGVHDDEGLVLDSLTQPYTIAWCQHLAKLSIFSS